MSRVLVGGLIIGLLLALAGCAAARPEMAARTNSVPAAAPAPAAPAATTDSFAGAAAEGSAQPADADRRIIRTADLSMVVTDAESAMQSITGLVTEAGGYIADSTAWRENEQMRVRATMRVPADQLDATLAALKALAVRVEHENIGGKDVTEEYTDLDAQLRNLEATETELRALLTEVRQKTQKAEDVLQVYQELTKVRGQIEQIKGRMQYLNNMTALATITVDLVPDVLAKPVVEPGWRPQETLKGAGRALVNTLKGLADVAIWLVVYLLPLLIIIAIPIVLLVMLVRWLVRRKRPARAPQA